MKYLVCVGKILTVLSNVLPNKDVGVVKQDVLQLVYTVQTFLPHVGLEKSKGVVNFSKSQGEK